MNRDQVIIVGAGIDTLFGLADGGKLRGVGPELRVAVGVRRHEAEVKAARLPAGILAGIADDALTVVFVQPVGGIMQAVGISCDRPLAVAYLAEVGAVLLEGRVAQGERAREGYHVLDEGKAIQLAEVRYQSLRFMLQGGGGVGRPGKEGGCPEQERVERERVVRSHGGQVIVEAETVGVGAIDRIALGEGERREAEEAESEDRFHKPAGDQTDSVGSMS
jgi:hypothetical protein